MSIFASTVPDLAIPNGGTDSNSLDWKSVMQDAEGLSVFAPAALDAVTYTWQGSRDGVTWVTLQDSNGTNIPVPAAAFGIIYNGVFSGIEFIRIHASGVSGGIRTFTLRKVWRDGAR